MCPLSIVKEEVMENKTYSVKVTSPGLTVMYRNRVSRTPVLFANVYESELQVLELQLKQKSMDYTIEENKSKESFIDEPMSDEVIIEENENVKVEELYPKEEQKPESILDKLIAEDE